MCMQVSLPSNRWSLAIAALCLLRAIPPMTTPAQAAEFQPPIVLVNDNSDITGFSGPTLSFVSRDDGQLLGHAPLGAKSLALQQSSNGRWAFVLTSGKAREKSEGRSMTTFDAPAKKPRTAPGGPPDPDGPTIVIVDDSARAVVARIPIRGSAPGGLWVLPGDSVLVASMKGDGSNSTLLTFVSLSSRTVTGELEIPADKLRVQGCVDPHRIYVISTNEKAPGGKGPAQSHIRIVGVTAPRVLADRALPGTPMMTVVAADSVTMVVVTQRESKAPAAWTIELLAAATLDSLGTTIVGDDPPPFALDPRTGLLLFAIRTTERGPNDQLVALHDRQFVPSAHLPGMGPFHLQSIGADSLLVRARNSLAVLRVSDGAVLSDVSLPFDAGELALTTDRSRGVIAEADGNRVGVVDLAHGRFVGTATTGRTSAKITNVLGAATLTAFSIWGAAYQAQQMAMFNAQVLSLASGGGPAMGVGYATYHVIVPGSGPVSLAIGPDDRVLYALNSSTKDITIVELDSLRVEDRMSIGSSAYGWTISRDGRRMLIYTGATDFGVYDVGSRQMIADCHYALAKFDDYPVTLTDVRRDRVIVMSKRGLTIVPLMGEHPECIHIPLPVPRRIAIPG